jgi:hypothetical protein
MAQICPTSCILTLLRGCGKINSPNVLMDLGGGSTILISLLFTKMERKRGKVCNALATFVNLTVVNYHGSSDRISSVNSLLIPMLLLQNFKRVIPPRTGLLRLSHSSPFSRFLVDLPKEGISVKRPIPGHPWRRVRGNNFLRTGRKSDLVQLMRN